MVYNMLKMERASEQTKTKYLIPWNNKEKAITGGGILLAQVI